MTNKVLPIECIQEQPQPLVQENIAKAVFSGLVRLLALLACIAGAGLAGRAGIAALPIKIGRRGVNFLAEERGEHPL